MNRTLQKLAAFAFVLIVSVVTASAITIDFPTTIPDSVGANGTRNYTVDGLTVTASAWSFRVGGDGKAYAGELGSWSYGLGVQNSSGDNSHTVDNQGYVDFILFQFSQNVVPTAIGLSSLPSWGGDTDIDVFLGVNPGAVNGKTNGELTSNGWTFLGSNTGGLASRTASINAALLSANSLIVSARYGETAPNDDFKIQSVTFTNSVPDGGMTLVLLGSSLTGLALIARSRKFALVK